MKIIRESPDKYGLQKVGNLHRLIKVIREYEDEQIAIPDLTKLLTGAVTENEITGIPDYNNTKIEFLNALQVAFNALNGDGEKCGAIKDIEHILRRYGRLKL